MFDLKRYRGTFAVSFSVVAVLILIDGTLGVTVGRGPAWLLPTEDPVGWVGTERIAGIVAGVTAENRHTPMQSGLGVILGRSTAREAIDPRVLEAQDSRNRRWLSLSGSGGSLNYMTDLADILFLSKLKPDIVVLAINPYMLAGHPYHMREPSASLAEVFDALSQRQFHQARTASSEWLAAQSWLLAHRSLINHQLRVSMYRFRLRMFAACGLESDALEPPILEPWKHLRLGYPDQQTDEYLQTQLRLGERLGRFSPASYSPQSTQASALVGVIARSRQRGARVCVVLSPERIAWRSKIPVQAEQCLREIIQANFIDTVAIVDMRATLPDEMFSDHYHLTESGARIASVILAEKLTKLNQP